MDWELVDVVVSKVNDSGQREIDDAVAMLKSLGYTVFRPKPVPKMKQCVCGCKRRDHVFVVSPAEDAGDCYKCQNCGLRSKPIRDASRREMVLAWNEAVEEEELKYGKSR